MKRIALALAAAFLGTGCIVVDDHDCSGTVTLEWDFEKANGAVPVGTISQVCLDAGVAYVDVFMNGAVVDRFWCTDGGVTVTAVVSGQYVFTVEGLDSFGVVQYREQLAVDARRCGDPIVHTRPSQGVVAIDYAFTPTNLCHAGSTYMAYAIRDDLTGGRPVLETGATGPACTVSGAAPSYVLPAGPFTLQYIQEMRDNGGGAFTVVARDCTDYAFNVPAGASTPVTPTLGDASTACP